MHSELKNFPNIAQLYFEREDGLLHQLGMHCTQADENGVIAQMPIRKHHLQSERSGLSSGALAIAIDTLFGLTVLLKQKSLSPIATIDLKLNHISEPGVCDEITFQTECYALTNELAFLRGSAFEGNSGKLLVSATATFMVKTHGPAFTT